MLRFWISRALPGVAIAVILALLVPWLLLRASLPVLDGRRVLPGLSESVTVTRDAGGVVTIDAGSQTDALQALGYVHAQERFFEMDLSRRAGAGELAALVGHAAVDLDRQRRVHRFRARAEDTWRSACSDERMLIEAYTRGVNAGLSALPVRPFPYLLLRQAPVPWRAEDTLLVVLAMFFDLQGGDNRFERERLQLAAALPAEVYALLTAEGTEWDAPLDGSATTMPTLPGPGIIDLQGLDPNLVPEQADVASGDFARGSNSWAVGGALTRHGAALVANDMHLNHSVPNIWFRARLRYGDIDVSGASLPGVPGIVVGSNGRVAWAFTNSYGDYLDWVRLTPVTDGEDGRYQTAHGVATITSIDEVIAVRGGVAETLSVQDTVFGPILAHDADGIPLALHWTAHRRGAVNTALVGMAGAWSVDEGLRIAAQSGIPAQNVVLGDSAGTVAWTIAGRLPQRQADRNQLLYDSAAGDLLTEGWLAAADYPVVRAPPHHRLWTANARVVGGEMATAIGNGGYTLASRATQIRDALFSADVHDEQTMLRIHLDDRALFLARWRELLLDVLATPDTPLLEEMRALVAGSSERATPDDVGYRLVRSFRLRVLVHVGSGFLAAARTRDPALTRLNQPQFEGIVWQLLSERPLHLLSPAFDNWEALLAHSAREVGDALADMPGGLAARTWGERNTAAIRHPLSRALPLLGRWLDMPSEPLPGDLHVPRVQSPNFGASQRMAVAPGHETQGYFHMPGGQSGHPLSPFYGAGHADWVAGKPTAFLPGPPMHHLTLNPTQP